MALKFEFRKDKIVIDAKMFLFKEFTDIWNGDRSKDKLKANKMLFFIFLLCDLTSDNPLKDVNSNKREREAKFRAFGDSGKTFSDKEHELLQQGVKRYIDLNSSVEEKVLEVFDKKADDIVKILETTKPENATNNINGVVTFESNASIISKALSKLTQIRKNRELLVSAIKNEALSEKVRGQLALSPLDKGLLNIKDLYQNA